MVFDHIGFNVSDFAQTKAFLVASLAPLNIGITMEGEGWAMVGRQGEGNFWFGSFGSSPGPIHMAFAATNREQVRQFYAAALAAGGKDNGAPGLRPQYHPNYYGAFVIGPDGHNFEAVCHAPEAS
ncbi:VOC family protein [Caenimonas koreensis]|uniref:VOC family protein n=1 Tax=Caenimonas koreensis DSM 17982 TaxID=1121255 RepID=A0A844B958_9BURK|nr:VOC family protein [Caenimonas koreensis]MRD48007.1 VOC family protein [Caenimonas koreensis DSM 17982]